MTGINLIRYLAIGRPDLNPQGGKEPNHELLCTFLSEEGDKEKDVYKTNAIKILGKSHKVQPGKRIRLTSENYEIHVQSEQGPSGATLLLIAITDTEFGVHHSVPTCFQEFVSLLHTHCPSQQWTAPAKKIKKSLEPVLSAIHRKYSTSSILEANKKVDQVKGVMQDNIDMALRNTERIEEIDQKTETLEASSQQFHANSKRVKCRFIKQRIKLIALIVAIIAIVITIIILSVALR